MAGDGHIVEFSEDVHVEGPCFVGGSFPFFEKCEPMVKLRKHVLANLETEHILTKSWVWQEIVNGEGCCGCEVEFYCSLLDEGDFLDVETRC